MMFIQLTSTILLLLIGVSLAYRSIVDGTEEPVIYVIRTVSAAALLALAIRVWL